MRNVYLLYEGDEYLSKDSLVLMGVFSSARALEKGAQTLIEQRAERNFDPRDYDYPITLADFIEEELTDFMENMQTSTGSVKFIGKEVELNKVEEI